MVATFKIDTAAFHAALSKVAIVTSKTAAELVNTKAYLIAVNAAHACKIANKARIAYVLGQTGEQVDFRKKATASTRRFRAKWKNLTYKNASFAERIIRKRAEKAGHVQLNAAEMEKRVRKMIVGRAASVGFIASGFVRAARQLRQFTKGVTMRETPKGIKIVPGGLGGKGVPAKAGSSALVAFVSNDVVKAGGRWQPKGKIFQPETIAIPAFAYGIEKERQSMLEYLKKNFLANWARIGVK